MIRSQYIGGYYQLSFSHLFTLIGIKHKQYIDEDYKFPYWDDHENIFWFYNKDGSSYYNYTENDIKKSIIIPVQLIKKI